jgi:hypothetical protein
MADGVLKERTSYRFSRTCWQAQRVLGIKLHSIGLCPSQAIRRTRVLIYLKFRCKNLLHLSLVAIKSEGHWLAIINESEWEPLLFHFAALTLSQPQQTWNYTKIYVVWGAVPHKSEETFLFSEDCSLLDTLSHKT